jgi:hypothetical protein
MGGLNLRTVSLGVTTLLLICSPASLASCMELPIDECPKLILTAVCNSEKRPCCPRYMAEVAGQWGTDVSTLRFEWTLSSGKIISGQGTSVIQFDTRRASGRRILLSVKVNGLENWPPVCSKRIILTLDRCRDYSGTKST